MEIRDQPTKIAKVSPRTFLTNGIETRKVSRLLTTNMEIMIMAGESSKDNQTKREQEPIKAMKKILTKTEVTIREVARDIRQVVKGQTLKQEIHSISVSSWTIITESDSQILLKDLIRWVRAAYRIEEHVELLNQLVMACQLVKVEKNFLEAWKE